MVTTEHLGGTSGQAPVRVLVVDDAPIILDRLIASLGLLDNVLIVGACHDGGEAISNIDRLEPDIVVLDIQLRDSSGWSVLQYVRRKRPDTLVFVFTNDVGEKVEKRFLDGGANRFFDKSFDFESLRDAVIEAAGQ